MKDKLNKALTNIDDKLIEEAANARCAERRVRGTIAKIAVPTAAAAAVAGVFLLTQPYLDAQNNQSGITLSHDAPNSGAGQNSSSGITELIEQTKNDVQDKAERLELLNNMFSAGSEGLCEAVETDSQTASSIYCNADSPAVLAFKNKIAVFTDGGKVLCFYDTSANIPDSDRMIALIDLAQTVNILKNDPTSGILSTVGNEELGDCGICVSAYDSNGTTELILQVVSHDDKNSSTEYFKIGFNGEKAVLSHCDEVSGTPLEKFTHNSDITAALVDGADMSALRLVVKNSQNSKVFAPFSSRCEYYSDNGIVVEVMREGLRHSVLIYDTTAIDEGGEWYFRGYSYYKESGSVCLYDNDDSSIIIGFSQNEDKSITVNEMQFPNTVCDANGDPVGLESSFHYEKVKAGDIFTADYSPIDFTQWEKDRLALIEKASAAFPKLSNIDIGYSTADMDTRLYFTAQSYEEITPDYDEELRYWLYRNTGENHPIVNISRARITDFSELISTTKARFPMLDNVGMGYESADSSTIVFSATCSRAITQQEYDDITGWITTMTDDVQPIVTISENDTKTGIVRPLAHYDDSEKLRVVPNEMPDFDYTQQQYFAAEIGTPVVSAADGEVMYNGWFFNYGFVTVIKHDGFCTMYYHLDPNGFTNAVGNKVRAGFLVGNVGKSGLTEESRLGYLYSDDENYYRQVIDSLEEPVVTDSE